MFQRDFVALGENQTRNFVARHKLGFNAISSLCLRIELVGVRVRVRARVRIPRQIRHSSDAAPAQRVRFDASLTTDLAWSCLGIPPAKLPLVAGDRDASRFQLELLPPQVQKDERAKGNTLK